MAGVGNGGGGGGGGNIRAGRAFVELYANDNAVYRSLERLKARFQSFAGLTIKAGLALGAGGAVALAPLKSALDTITEQGKLGAVADAFGLSAEEASRLFGIMQSGGSDLRDATEGLVTLGQRVTDALNGTGKEAAELFDNLGVSAAEFQGLNPAQQFYKLLDSLKKVSDPAQRVQLLLKAVGEDTGKNLIPVLSMSADQLRDLGDAFQQSSADVAQARATSLQYTLATARLSAVWRDVAAALAPALAELLGWIQRAIGPLAAWVKENRAAVLVAVQAAAAVVGVGAALVGLGLAAKLGAVALGGVTLVLKGVGLAIAALLSPVGLVVAAITGLGAALLTQTSGGRRAIDGLRGTFAAMGQTFSEAWGGIKSAVEAGDLELAFKIAGKGIEAVWKTMLAGMAMAFKDFIEKNRETMVALAAITGALKGARVGRMAGPWGALVGLGAGAAVAGFGADAALDALEKSIDTKGLDAAAQRARDELARLVADGRRAGPRPADPIMNPAPGMRAAVRVGSQGSFTAAMAAQRFSLFDDVPLQQLKEQKKANVNLAAINNNVGGLVRALAFK